MAAASSSRSTRARATRRSATGSRATSAAAPATTTSSRRCRPRRRLGGGRWRPPRKRPASSDEPVRARRTRSSSPGGHVRRQPQPPRNALGVRRPQPVRARADQASTSRRRSRSRASWPRTPAPTSSGSRPAADGVGDQRQAKNPPHKPLTKDKARYVGDGVAVVVAESRALAKDAVELVEVDWEPLAAVTGIKEALAPGAPIVHEEFGTNDAGSWSIEGDSPAAAGAVRAVLRGSRPRHDQGGVLPRPPDPERDRATRGRRRPERGRG